MLVHTWQISQSRLGCVLFFLGRAHHVIDQPVSERDHASWFKLSKIKPKTTLYTHTHLHIKYFHLLLHNMEEKIGKKCENFFLNDPLDLPFFELDSRAQIINPSCSTFSLFCGEKGRSDRRVKGREIIALSILTPSLCVFSE